MIGQTILHYKILAKLGEGGMGEVYLAEDTKLERKVALKFLPQHLSTDPKLQARFQREARAAAALNHPNIITVYEIGEHEGRAYIAMEYVDGQSLRELMSQSELPVDRIIDILSQVCEGLSKAHQAGIVHRDLKPENIMLDADGKVKILDFGLAKLKGKSKLSFTKSTMGTISYMAPEQCEGVEVDHRTDIWAAGVMLYEMTAAKPPFDGEHEAAIIYAIVNEEPKSLAQHKPGVSPDLQRIVDKALDKDRATRYQGISALLADLERVKKSESVTAKRMSSRQKNKLAKQLIRFAVLFALVISLALYLSKKQPVQPILATHKQITFTGKAIAPAISSDGQFMAYVSEEETSDKKVMIQDLTGGQALEIFSGIRTPRSLRWSPDGAELVFNAWLSDSLASIMIIPRMGGSFRIIKTGNVIASFSPDGTQIATSSPSSEFIRFRNKNTHDYISIQISKFHSKFIDFEWSPLGNYIAFLTTTANLNEIWTTNLDGSEQHKIVTDSLRLYSPRWSAKGDAIYYLRSHEQTKDLMKIKVNTVSGKAQGQPLILQTGLQIGESFTVSRDNKRLLYSRKLQFSNLWLKQLDEHGKKEQFQSKKITTGTSWIHRPAISPDGKYIAFSNGKWPTADIFVMQIDGGATQQITFLDSYNAGVVWSPDGKELAFGSTKTGTPKVWRVPASGGTPSPFMNTELSDRFQLTWSPGPNILYQKSDGKNFYILNPESEEEKPLLKDEAFGRYIDNPRFSPHGKEIALLSRFSRVEENPLGKIGLWVVSIEGGKTKFLETGFTFTTPITWLSTGDWIYATDHHELPREIFLVSRNGGLVKNITALPAGTLPQIDISQDNKSLVFPVREENTDVWLMENFDPESEIEFPVVPRKLSGMKVIDYAQKGLDYSRKGKFAEAEMLFRKGLELNSKHPALLNGLGWSLTRQQKYPEAEEFFKRGYALQPDNFTIINGLTWSLIYQQKFREAETIFHDYLHSKPPRNEIFEGLVSCYLALEKYDAARDYVDTFVDNAPPRSLYYREKGKTQLGIIELLRKNYHDAEKFLYQAIEQNASYSQSYQVLGYLFIEQGNFQKAINMVQITVAIDSSFESKNLLAWALVKGEIDIDSCLLIGHTLVGSKPETWNYTINTYHYLALPEHTLGLAYLKKGEYEKAVQYLEQAAAFAPERQAIQDDLQSAKRKLQEMRQK